MKKIIFFLIITSFLVGCVTEEGKTYYYTIQNNSGVTVEIIPYSQQGELLPNKKIILLNGQNISKKDFDGTPGGGSPNISRVIRSDESLTKVEFVFNNLKKNVYQKCGISINGIVGDCSESRNIFREEFNNEQTEVYTITPEDYQNATDCNGNCY
ncbi:hypothetical protein MHJ94_07725 [Chryseobacterium taklimakanense]|uniref:hypothetical protein n=1 Tax=Chryseobacterium taklimakanense TaxID=536441 RepID=UPI001EF40895|nr:hypothetical protein [Chryseobacterium taklimakanense]MCG7281182.1 hypothetical protein [Chryseobacterium taklimakanense]